jgi:hypothetical protein
MMARTTIDLDPSVLADLKRRSKTEGKSMSQLASELLASAMANPAPATAESFEWNARPMGALIDIDDKEALYRILDGR